MAIRMHFPADVNPDTDAKFSRGMAEAFPYDPKLTTTARRFPAPNRPSLWLCAALVVLNTLGMSGCGSAEAEPATARITATHIKRAAAGAWHCPGMHAEWLDATTVQCLKESP